MHRHIRILPVTLAILACVLCRTALSSGWYAGMEGGYVEHTFKVHYEYTYGGTPDDFTDPAYGMMAGLIGGYTFLPAERIALSIQARLSADNAEWKLSTDEPANLSYSMPWAYSISLLPEVKLCERVHVFGEAGIGQGYVRLKKTSETASRYTNNEWLAAYALGGGVRIDLTSCWQALVQYRRTTYDKTSFKSHLPDGTHWETIDCDTTTDFYSAGLVYRF